MKLYAWSALTAILLIISGSSLASGRVSKGSSGEPSFTGRTYVARWTSEALIVSNRRGGALVRWPIGSACTPADPDLPVLPASFHAPPHPTMEMAGGALKVTWRWLRPAPDPIAEQVEQCLFYPDRVEFQVRLRWRGKPARLVRMAYGERLAPGCCDLEGLWQSMPPAPDAPARQIAPVPGLFKWTGITPMTKRASPPAGARNLELVIGGIDDGDTTLWNGSVIGRTPSNRAALSWEKVRRYAVPSSPSAGPGEIQVRVQNVEGNGGIWRGPCVLGPRSALEASAGQDGWTRATATGTALYHWCPDTYKQPLKGRFTVSLTSRDRTRDPVPENATSGGRFLIPPYVVAVDGTNGWWGLGTLDLPRSEDGLRVEWRDGTLACPFLLATDPQAGAWTVGPRLAILPGQSRSDVLRVYRRSLPAPRPAVRPAWWGGPTYCTWGDQVYGGQRDATGGGKLTDAHVKLWLQDLQQQKINVGIVTLDAGWWQLSKALVAEIHRSGRHVLLWTQPHWGPLGSPEIRSHPGWAVKDENGSPVAYDPHNWLLDYTVPDVRGYMARALRSYVLPDGWDADGIKLDFPYTSAPVWDRVGDTAWGAGEQYRARVMQWIYDTIKAAKPDALVTAVNANPLFGPVEDYCRLNDDWTHDPQTYRRRAAAALAFGFWVDCDDWYAYEDYLPVQAVERPLWGNVTLMSARYRADLRNRRLPLSTAWATRLSVIFDLARRIPPEPGERCLYDPELNIARRETNQGTLVAAALPLEKTLSPGKTLPSDGRLQALVVRAGDRLLLTAIASGKAVVPTPSPAVRVTGVRHDGTQFPVPFGALRGAASFRVQDAAGPVAYYRIDLRKTRVTESHFEQAETRRRE